MKLSWVHSTSRPVEPSRLESPEPPELSRRQGITKWRILAWFDPSGFIKSPLDVCSCWVLLSVSVLRSPTEVNLRTIWRRQFLHITTPCRQPDLMARSTVVEGLHSGAVASPIQRGWPKDLVTWELLRGLGYSGSSLPSWLGLSPVNLLYREDFPSLYTWGRHDLDSVWVVSLGLTARWC